LPSFYWRAFSIPPFGAGGICGLVLFYSFYSPGKTHTSELGLSFDAQSHPKIDTESIRLPLVLQDASHCVIISSST